jgi:hypothetical protein
MTLKLVTLDTPCPPSPSGELFTAAFAAAAALTSAEPDYRSSISWLSAHCRAIEHVTFPAARHILQDKVAVKRQLKLARDLEHHLLRLHQAVNGDSHAVGLPLDSLATAVRRRLEEHLEQAGRLVDDVREALTTAEWEALVLRHHVALADAPTRPHPYAPHSGLAERIAFVVGGALDRLMQTLDSQTVAALPAPTSPPRSDADAARPRRLSAVPNEPCA